MVKSKLKNYKVTKFINTAGEKQIEVYRFAGTKKLIFSGYKVQFTDSMFSGKARDIYITI